jgi:hypothetical protein
MGSLLVENRGGMPGFGPLASGAGLASHEAKEERMFGLGSVGLALGAISTLSSLLETAAAGINKAVSLPTGAATGQTFDPATATSAGDAGASTYGTPKDAGVVFPKFDQRTQAALLAYQEMHRGG